MRSAAARDGWPRRHPFSRSRVAPRRTRARRAHFEGKVFSNPGVVKESSVLGYLWLRVR
jgi:hypothetical protein